MFQHHADTHKGSLRVSPEIHHCCVIIATARAGREKNVRLLLSGHPRFAGGLQERERGSKGWTAAWLIPLAPATPLQSPGLQDPFFSHTPKLSRFPLSSQSTVPLSWADSPAGISSCMCVLSSSRPLSCECPESSEDSVPASVPE